MHGATNSIHLSLVVKGPQREGTDPQFNRYKGETALKGEILPPDVQVDPTGARS